MTKYKRLAVITVCGLAAMFLLTWALYALRDAVELAGYSVSPDIFLIAFFIVVGGAFFLARSLALRELKRLSQL